MLIFYSIICNMMNSRISVHGVYKKPQTCRLIYRFMTTNNPVGICLVAAKKNAEPYQFTVLHKLRSCVTHIVTSAKDSFMKRSLENFLAKLTLQVWSYISVNRIFYTSGYSINFTLTKVYQGNTAETVCAIHIED